MNERQGIVIAIDGPAGAGKSSTAKRVAEALGYLYLDSGAMYRAVTLAAMRRGWSFADEQALVDIAKGCRIGFKRRNNQQQVLLNGEDVTDAIRTPKVTDRIAPVAASAGVRAILVRKQQALGKTGGLVAEGRDIGTVVFPKAELKIFMIASLEERAKRRAAELAERGIRVEVAQLAEDIRRRDESDSARDHGALKQAADAVVLDTSNLTLDEQVERIIALAKERGA